MEAIVTSDWFFFITAIAVVVITVLLATALVYSFFILRKVKMIVDTVKEESDGVIASLHAVRAQLQSNSGFMSKIPALVMGIIKLFTSVRRTKSKKKHD